MVSALSNLVKNWDLYAPVKGKDESDHTLDTSLTTPALTHSLVTLSFYSQPSLSEC